MRRTAAQMNMPRPRAPYGTEPSSRHLLSPAQIVVAERNRTNPLTSGRVNRVANGRRHQRHDFLANSRNPAVGLNKIQTDIARIVAHPNRFILVEIALLDRGIPERDLL